MIPMADSKAMQGRPTMTDVLMWSAQDFALRGTCSRRQVGCVIADEHGNTVGSGYNGAVRGLPHCKPHNDYQPCDVSEHAERNAIYACARNGVPILGKRMYVTDAPCHGCARAIVQCGIVSVTYWRPYRVTSGLDLLIAAGIQLLEWFDPRGQIRDVEGKL